MSATMTYPPEIVDVMGGRPPTEEQWRAISWPLEPFVLVAGRGLGQDLGDGRARRLPGARRTRKLAADAPGVLPGNVLCLTFTNKATENLQQRSATRSPAWISRRAKSPRS